MKKRGIALLNFLLCLIFLFGCKGGAYMEDFINVKWTSENPTIEFSYTEENQGMGIGTLVKNGKRIEIVCMFTLSKNIEIYDKQDFDFSAECIDWLPLLIGKYVVKNEKATVTVVEDNLFNGEYLNKQFVLCREVIV